LAIFGIRAPFGFKWSIRALKQIYFRGIGDKARLMQEVPCSKQIATRRWFQQSLREMNIAQQR
jgi:hypothetical protein